MKQYQTTQEYTLFEVSPAEITIAIDLLGAGCVVRSARDATWGHSGLVQVKSKDVAAFRELIKERAKP